MIDFSKPMRVRDTGELFAEPHSEYAVRFLGGQLYVIMKGTGECYQCELAGLMQAENIPEKPQPKVRYQAQYSHDYNGAWYDAKDRVTKTGLIAWLIETDHGPDEKPRYTYEREEVVK